MKRFILAEAQRCRGAEVQRCRGGTVMEVLRFHRGGFVEMEVHRCRCRGAEVIEQVLMLFSRCGDAVQVQVQVQRF